jgi:hypothetical protein
MVELIVPESVVSLLAAAKEPLILRRENGEVLGEFTPNATNMTDEEFEKCKARFDLESMKRRKANDNGKRLTTAEVLKRLDALELPS